MVFKYKVAMKKLIFIFLFFISSCSTAQQITIYTIGDSTMANKPNPKENPERGWAQMLPDFFTSDVVVDNRAVNGRSTRSFITEKRWEQVWIDSGGAQLKLYGNKKGNQMILASKAVKNKNGKMVVNRVTWTNNADGTVRQLWEVLINDKVDNIAFDGLYKKIE